MHASSALFWDPVVPNPGPLHGCAPYMLRYMTSASSTAAAQARTRAGAAACLPAPAADRVSPDPHRRLSLGGCWLSRPARRSGAASRARKQQHPMEEALSALKEAEDELHRLEHETQELLADESDSSQATMRSLRAMEAKVPLAMRTMEAALDDYEMEIEDSAIDDKDVPNARLDQAKHDYALRKTSLRVAKIKVAQRSQVAQQNDRTALLGGGTLNAEEMALRRRHRAKEEDPDGEKAAAQSISVLQKMKLLSKLMDS